MVSSRDLLTIHPLCGRGAAQWRGAIPRHNRGKNWEKLEGFCAKCRVGAAALTLRSASVAWGSLMLTMGSQNVTGNNRREQKNGKEGTKDWPPVDLNCVAGGIK